MQRLISLMIATIISLYTIQSRGQTEGKSERLPSSAGMLQVGDLIERVASNSESTTDFSGIASELKEQERQAVDLNSASREELARIPFLDARLRENLEFYRAEYGDLLSIHEMLAIPGFDSLLIKRIAPFIMLRPGQTLPPPTPSNLARYGHHSLLVRYEQDFPREAGYQATDTLNSGISENSAYAGSPQRYTFRYEYSWFDKITAGFAGEKDPGEQFFSGAQSGGMDYYTYCIAIRTRGWLKRLIIGNFRGSFGQGLTMGSGSALTPAPGFTTGANRVAGIGSSLGMNEVGGLRGVAGTIRLKNTEVTLFGSYLGRDATLSDGNDTGIAAGMVTSLNATGYHRTPAEITRKNRVKELFCGGNISFTWSPGQNFGLRAGVTATYLSYSAQVAPKPGPGGLYSFSGRENMVAGLDLKVRVAGVYLFGEISRSNNGGIAWYAGLKCTPDPRVTLDISGRNYGAAYQNTFGQCFSQNGVSSNEAGVYLNLALNISSRLSLAGFIDIYAFPWVKSRIDAPSSGHESGLMLTWTPARSVNIDLRCFGKVTDKNSPEMPDGQLTTPLAPGRLAGARGGISWSPGDMVHLMTRVEWRGEACDGSALQPGYLILQEIRMNKTRVAENITVRFTLFDIIAYGSRIYVFEPEVLYGYSVPAYQGQGVRICSVVKWRIFKGCLFWLRGGVTLLTDREVTGSYADLTKGSARSELTGQIQIQF